MSSRGAVHRWLSLVVALLAVSLVGGCGRKEDANGPYVINYTDAPLYISYVHNGQTTPLSVTAIPQSATDLGTFRDRCSHVALLALDASGNVVARHDAPLCAGDRWVIGTRPSASP